MKRNSLPLRFVRLTQQQFIPKHYKTFTYVQIKTDVSEVSYISIIKSRYSLWVTFKCYVTKRLRWSRGSVLGFGVQVRGFKPGRSHRIFQGEKKKTPQHAFLRKGSKAAYLRHVKEPESVSVEVAAFGPNYRPFLAQVVPPFTIRVSGGDTWRCK